jgi:hypothetical protein
LDNGDLFPNSCTPLCADKIKNVQDKCSGFLSSSDGQVYNDYLNKQASMGNCMTTNGNRWQCSEGLKNLNENNRCDEVPAEDREKCLSSKCDNTTDSCYNCLCTTDSLYSVEIPRINNICCGPNNEYCSDSGLSQCSLECEDVINEVRQRCQAPLDEDGTAERLISLARQGGCELDRYEIELEMEFILHLENDTSEMKNY